MRLNSNEVPVCPTSLSHYVESFLRGMFIFKRPTGYAGQLTKSMVRFAGLTFVRSGGWLEA